jgi:hypothetical protein
LQQLTTKMAFIYSCLQGWESRRQNMGTIDRRNGVHVISVTRSLALHCKVLKHINIQNPQYFQ